VALSKGKHVIKLGPMFWGLYPGAIAFKTPEDALAYMKKKEMNEEESVIYRLSGNYKSDVNQESTPHHINKSLVMIEKLKYGSA
jgi:negative regulator of genetic competence, sporulation and motility